MARICLLGGGGFIGRSVAEALVERAHAVIIPTRRREWTKRNLLMLPTVEVVDADIHDDATLDRLFAGCDAVINLVGVLHSKPGQPYGREFERVHVALAKRIVAACEKSGVRRLLHMSALGAAADAPSEYLRSKAAGAAIVLGAAGRLDVTVFRPSVVFGRDDAFLNVFAGRLPGGSSASMMRQLMVLAQRFLWFVPLPGAQAKMQPVYVEDVAAAFVRALFDDASFGKSYDLVGPKVYTLAELVHMARKLSGCSVPILPLGRRLGLLQAWFMELAPGQLLSRDNVRSLSVDSVSNEPLPFGIRPASLDAIAPTYLANQTPRSRYMQLRDRAGRHVT